MRWKKILITAVLLLAVLIATIYVILLNLDFNRYKPRISQLVYDATGRRLTIDGNIDVAPGIRPTLIAENVGFENANWGSQPELVRVKRLEAQLAFLPLIWGKIDLAHLVLVEPEVIVEFDKAGTSNFAFDNLSEEKKSHKIPPPPLIFSNIHIEQGLFVYRDARSDFTFSVRIDRLEGEIEGFDRPLHLDFRGAFDEIPLTLKGIVGPIWAWVEPGYTLPAHLTATAGGATATIKGELRDPINFKDLEFDIAARGASIAEIAGLAGLSGVPELGSFNLAATVNDSHGRLAVDNLDIQLGNQTLAAIKLTGEVKDALALQDVSLKCSISGQDSAQLTQLGLPALPLQGAFQITARIWDPAAKRYTIGDLSAVLDENEMKGQVDINLAEKIPVLTANLGSQKFTGGPFNLEIKMTGPIDSPAIKKFDFELGNPDLVRIRLNGFVENLRKLQGVDINFQADGKDLANLRNLTGQPLPVRGAFSAVGKVLIPIHKKLQIPNLKITAGKNNITGSLDLDLRGDQPQLKAKLASPKLDLPSILLPNLAKQKWAQGLGLMRPVKLAAALAGFKRKIALEKIDLQAGTSTQSAELHLSGSVANLLAQRGIDLRFALRGHNLDKLKVITGQPYFFAPVPGEGAYTLSGQISDPAPAVYEVRDFKFGMSGTVLSGSLDFNLAGDFPVYDVKLSSPKFNMKPFPIPKEAAYARLNQIDDLGPLKIQSKVVVEGERLSMPNLYMQAGHKRLAEIEVKGSINNLTTQTGINLNVYIQGDEIANLKEITDQSIPLKGAYGLSASLTDPAPKNYKLGDLKLKLGENNITGALDLNLSGQKLRLAADLAAPKFTLQPVALPAVETLSRIENLGPLMLAFELAGADRKFTLDNLDFKLGREDLLEVLLKGKISDLSAIQGMNLEFIARGSDMSNFKKMGGPDLPFKGPFDVAARINDPEPKVYKIPSFNATVGDNNQTGWLELDFSASRPRLTGELSSDKFDLRPLLAKDDAKNIPKTSSGKTVPQKRKEPEAKTRSSKPGDRYARVFSDEPFQFKGLQIIDAHLKFRDKQVLLPSLALDDVVLELQLKNGHLEMKPFTFSIGGGKADVQLALQSQETPAALAATVDIDQLAIGPMLDKLGYQRSVEGNMNAALNFDSTGNSIAAWMAGLNGNTRITVGQGRMTSEYLAILEEYLGSGILDMINPFQKKREYTPVNCFVNEIEIRGGLADIKILLDTDRTSIFGAGDVNLKTERLDMGIKPTPKKGAIPTGISFSFRELSQPFRLGGTLANPQLAIDAGRTAFVVGKMAGAVALGPVGIAAFFADVSVGKQDPCAVALGKTAIKGQSSDETKGEKKSGGFFKRLFRK